MKKLMILAVAVLAMVAVPVWAGEKETLEQQLGANVAQAQKLSSRMNEIQEVFSKIPKVVELQKLQSEVNAIPEVVKLSKESNEISAKLQKLGEENQGILKKLDALKK